MFGFEYLRDVTTLSVDAGKCNGCRTCTRVCPHAVMAVEDGSVRIVSRDRCMECGACARNCEQGAITVQAGVGCAAAVIGARLTGGEEVCCGPECGCG